jgi:hypothetical protein
MILIGQSLGIATKTEVGGTNKRNEYHRKACNWGKMNIGSEEGSFKLWLTSMG